MKYDARNNLDSDLFRRGDSSVCAKEVEWPVNSHIP